ncbi:anchored repeat-type ABC transporter permease subunit [Pseudonocardia phyllosphaerae]|uniref:anchored repeat-type ABC transporter permease subunit n=1 Tax=Pseudonocardia phyllosphaerae TaxID=3390502 RepID=UPI003977EBCB
MNDLFDVVLGPWEFDFWRRALLVALLSGLVCGVVGCHVVLRGMAFIGDAVSHSVFPGIAIAFALGLDLTIGGAVAGIATALVVAVFARNRRLGEDSVIGVFFAAAFGLGIVVLSATPGYGGSLESFLFGSILGISDGDLAGVVVIGALVLAAAAVLHPRLVAVGLDPETASASGLPVFRLNTALYVLVTLAIVMSLQAVGNILVLALLITPAATARLLTDRLETMMLLAPAIGALGSVVGLYLSFAFDLAAGGLIVLVLTAVFVVCWLGAPKHGVLARRRSRYGHVNSSSIVDMN